MATNKVINKQQKGAGKEQARRALWAPSPVDILTTGPPSPHLEVPTFLTGSQLSELLPVDVALCCVRGVSSFIPVWGFGISPEITVAPKAVLTHRQLKG